MIAPSQIPNPYVKPRWQAPVGVMESVVSYNCRKYGMPRPVFTMPLWEGAGDRAFDLSGYGNYGDLKGNTTWTNEGLSFDGAGDYVSCGDTVNSLISSTSYSVAAWIKTTTISENNMILGYRSTTSANAILWQLDHNTNDIRLIVRDDAGNVAVGSKLNSITTNKLYYIVGVRDGGTVNVYVNCVVGTSDTDTFGAITANAYNIGAITPGAPPQAATMFKGTIMLPTVFNLALSPSQIKFLYDNPYFMYRIPEELYGSKPAVIGAIMNQFQKANIGADLYNGAIIA